MAKDKNTWIMILVIIGIIFIFGMFFQKQNPIFSILPEGQNNHNLDCSFITSIDQGPDGWDINDYYIDYVDYGIPGEPAYEDWWINLNTPIGRKTLNYEGRMLNDCENFFTGGTLLDTKALGNFQITYYPPHTPIMDNDYFNVVICDTNTKKGYVYGINEFTKQNVNLTCGSNTNLTCTPNCFGKCGGVSDGCSGTCNDVCQTVCTQEVKQCSDGSYVSRNSNINCEFNPCLNIQVGGSCESLGPINCLFNKANGVAFNLGTFGVTWLYLIIGVVVILLVIMITKK